MFVRRRDSIESLQGKHRKVCERCLTITKNNKQCPKDGYLHLRAISICIYSGRNKQNVHVKIG